MSLQETASFSWKVSLSWHVPSLTPVDQFFEFHDIHATNMTAESQCTEADTQRPNVSCTPSRFVFKFDGNGAVVMIENACHDGTTHGPLDEETGPGT